MDDTLIRQLLEETLESGRTPEDVCADHPELLAEVRDRLARLRAIESQVEAIFPTPARTRSRAYGPQVILSGRLPQIPGHHVEAVIGRGGMGVVYRAKHATLGRTVAVKMVLMGAYAPAKDLQSLLREAEAVATLQHPNIVQVYEVGELDGLPYFTMEYVEGGTLASKLSGSPQGARASASLAAILADAMQTAHDRGIVHRDLKPTNILLTADAIPKIADFSIARNLGADQTLTLGGARLGTPSYMAPEQAAGTEGAFSPAVDVYALGAVLYEMMTGRPPFRADTPSETQRQVIKESPAPPSRLNMRIPRDLENICLKCLHKEPARRYASAAALARDLRRFLAGEPIEARPVGRIERLARWTRRNPTETALLAAVLALVAVAGYAGAREWASLAEREAQAARWEDRLATIIELQHAGRFEEVRAILGRVPEAVSTQMRASVERARADLELVERLDAIRHGRDRFKDGGGLDYDLPAGQYLAAFSQGIGTFDQSPRAVAAKHQSSPVRSAIVAALDDWAVCMTAEHRPWVLEVARSLDPDPWRDAVRDPARWADVDHLARLATDPAAERQPVTIRVAMATRWRRLGGDPTQFLLRTQRSHPDDFWVNFELGHLYFATSPETAIGYLRAALAVRPHSGAAQFNLGAAFLKLEQWDQARHHFERALADDPGHTWARRNLAQLQARAGQYDEAIANLQAVLDLHPADLDCRLALGGAYIRSGRAEEWRERWKRELEAHPHDAGRWDGYAELCLFMGDPDEYDRACAELIRQSQSTTDPRACERAGRACLLAPAPEPRLREATRLIDRALAADEAQAPLWARPYFLFAKALAEYRAGRFDAARTILAGEAGGILGPAPGMLLAMTEHRRGAPAAAKHAYDTALAAFDWNEINTDTREAQMYHILRREAESLLNPPAK
jgi:eukaryotic-like serine/threonine-protein kinase